MLSIRIEPGIFSFSYDSMTQQISFQKALWWIILKLVETIFERVEIVINLHLQFDSLDTRYTFSDFDYSHLFLNCRKQKRKMLTRAIGLVVSWIRLYHSFSIIFDHGNEFWWEMTKYLSWRILWFSVTVKISRALN